MPALAKSGAGIDLLKLLQATHDARASFLCRAFSYISMVGWAGASQDAPVSCNTGKVNPVQSTTHGIDLSSGGFITRYRRLPNGYYPNPSTFVRKLSIHIVFQCQY
ncbi:ash family protein [Obesumbacterium proteus]|uniref:ash family protein n=1 Tax=Obesumbacterium proteus TaxID=82983 RepID=UPI003C6E6311